VTAGGKVADALQAFRQLIGPCDMLSYLVMMAPRLMECRRALKPTGSMYLHCDPAASHYLKLLMDAVFGPANFRTEIVWKRSSAHSDAKQGRAQHGRIHDVIFFYTKTNEWFWNQVFTPYDQTSVDSFYKHTEAGTGRRYRLGDLTGPGGAAKGNPSYEVMGVTRFWRYSKEKMAALIQEGRVVQTKPGAVPASWETDRQVLLHNGHDVQTLRQFPTFVEAEVRRGADGVILQWVQDSAFRFFPLVEHPDFGLALHPFDLATNKVLALVGRAAVRDWVDIIHCHASLQSFGLLVWATSGKDPGLSPSFILEQAARSAHYAKSDLATLAFDGTVPDIEGMVKTWRMMLREADDIAALLPEDHVGTCILTRNGDLFDGTIDALQRAVENDMLVFHEGAIRGAWPRLRPHSEGLHHE